jgi:hypothetical protein
MSFYDTTVCWSLKNEFLLSGKHCNSLSILLVHVARGCVTGATRTHSTRVRTYFLLVLHEVYYEVHLLKSSSDVLAVSAL